MKVQSVPSAQRLTRRVCTGIALTTVASCLLVAMAMMGSAVQAQGTLAQGIYSCMDAKGRKLTSDRPIPECLDREQKVLNPSGTLQAKIGPTLTAQERAEIEAKDRLAQEERAKRDEEKRRDRALLVRYPAKATHDAERAEAIKQIGVVRTAAINRAIELVQQRTAIQAEMEFYKKDPTKAPAALRRQLDDVSQGLAVQGRFIAEQDSELNRINARFDEELARLVQLWPLMAKVAPGGAAQAASSAKSTAAKAN